MKNKLPKNHDYQIGDYVFVHGIDIVVKVETVPQQEFLNAQGEDANRYATEEEITIYNG